MKTSPKIHLIAAMWSMTHYPSAKREWSLERKIRAIVDAGFDGFATSPGPEHLRLAKKYGLIIAGYVATGKASQFHRDLKYNADHGAHYINVQLADHDTSTAEALRLTLRLMKEGEKLGVEPAVELHRDTCTETPEKSWALADAYRKATGKVLPMTLDFSHPAIIKHLHPGNYAERLLDRPEIVKRANQIHLRPFNGHHCQIPVTDGRGRLTEEIRQWLPFAEALFRMWRTGKQKEVLVVPELGPVAGGYNLTTLPNSWEDAIVLKDLIRKAWNASARPRS